MTPDAAVAAALHALGPGAEVVEVRLYRRGGLFGFFPAALGGIRGTAGPFAPCQHCGTGTWAIYDGASWCRRCAWQAAAGDAYWAALDAQERRA